MAKERISSNVDRKLAVATKERAAELGVSVSAFIEMVVQAALGQFNIYQENKQLRCARRQAEKRAADLKTECNELSRKVTYIRSERDLIKKEREHQLRQIADKLGLEQHACPSQDFRTIDAKIEMLCRSHDIFKASSEEKASELEVCESRIEVLLNRGWWQRLRNVVPWD